MFEEDTIFSFPNPAKLPDWTPPQSKEFYARLVQETGEYKYPWNSTFEGPTAEMIMEQKILSNLSDNGSKILDVGCGHGDFTVRFSSIAKQIVGIDITEGFVVTANKNLGNDSIQFLQIIAKDRLPFTDNYFDVAFTKKGPTEWYQEGNRVVRPGGLVCGLYHGGTDGGLRRLFPGLYSPAGEINFQRAIEKLKINLRIEESGLSDIHVEPIEEIEYLASPEDVLKKECFGQSNIVKEYVWKECLRGVEEIFYKNATSKGLKVINYYYLVKARAA
jgi:SAM-dependent methyltransferase